MTHILHLDASARPGLAGKDQHGSHSRNLSHRFISQWQARRPQDVVAYRDIGQNPPSIISHDWIASSFTPEPKREAWMHDTLAESDRLVDELIAADVLVIGTPLYNFGMPAALKAWIDQVVRPGRTVDVVITQGVTLSSPLNSNASPGDPDPALTSRSQNLQRAGLAARMGSGPDGLNRNESDED